MINDGISLNKEKFKQVLHYIISNVGDLDNIGKTVLWKMLYFSDFDHYEIKEVPLTGERYVKLPKGPAPRDFDNLIQELEKESKVERYESKYCEKPQQKFRSISQPKLDLLNKDEIQIIDKTIKKLSSMNATQVSAYSHEDTPWKASENMEEIDYELVFYRNPIYSAVEKIIN